MKYRDWNEMQRKLEALYVLDNALTDPSEEYLRLIRKTEDGDKLHYHVDNGAGDSLSVIFTEKLVLVKGFAHESALNLFAKEQEEQSILERIYAGLPEEYQSLFSLEEKRETTFFLWYDGELHQNSLGENDGGQWLLAYAFESFEKFRDFAKDYYEQEFSESLLRQLYEAGGLSDKELEELIYGASSPSSQNSSSNVFPNT